jgi:hypothetical protein
MIQVVAEAHSKSRDVPLIVMMTEVSVALVGVIIVSDPARCTVNVPVVLKLTVQMFPIRAVDAAGRVSVCASAVTRHVAAVSSIATLTAVEVTALRLAISAFCAAVVW